MASPARRLATNVSGDFFVDSSCIDCDTCRWMAPAVFDSAGDQARVHRQPADEAETEDALRALLSCPTGSIGTLARHDLSDAKAGLPALVDGDVFHCGYHSEKSFGATSYLIRRDRARGGNVLVDSPRFTAPLVERLEELGGVAWMVLTHQDDVADHARFAERFGCRRVIHADDVGRDTREVELQIEGREALALDRELRVVPVPGHTAGSMCLIDRGKYLFSGDHVAWSETRGQVIAFRDACWYDWTQQIASMERLLLERFEWILPGHGRRCRFEPEEMRRALERCIAWMRSR